MDLLTRKRRDTQDFQFNQLTHTHSSLSGSAKKQWQKIRLPPLCKGSDHCDMLISSFRTAGICTCINSKQNLCTNMWKPSSPINSLGEEVLLLEPDWLKSYTFLKTQIGCLCIKLNVTLLCMVREIKPLHPPQTPFFWFISSQRKSENRLFPFNTGCIKMHSSLKKTQQIWHVAVIVFSLNSYNECVRPRCFRPMRQ